MSKSKLRPLQDRIIITRLDQEDKTASGLYIPDSAKEKPQQGKVVAVGKGRVKDDGTIQPLDIKVGDTVLFGKYSGQDIKLDEQDVVIMKEDDVYAIVE